LPLLVAGILVLGGLGAVATHNQENDLKTLSSVTFSQPVIKSEEEFVTISIDEANSFIMEQGKPMLPCYEQTFTFPFKTNIKSVICTPTNIQTQTISKDVIPTPKAVVLGQTVPISQDSSINYGTEPYPSKWFDYSLGGGSYNGELSVILKVQINPVKYYPVEKKIEWAKDVNIAIEYEPSNEQPTYREEYQLIVIGPDEFSDELAPLITHKIGRGVSAKFVGLNEIYTGTGRDNQEKIKYFIKDAIESWATGNVLLVGSNSKLPTRITHVLVDYPPNPIDDEEFVSDLYYADIYNATGAFCDWDFNGNNVFGEYAWDSGCSKNCDKVDLYPDVYLGRLACRNGGEVTTCVNKIIDYEYIQAYQTSWFKNLVVVGGDSFPDEDGDINEGELINQKVIDMMTGFIADKQWVSNGKLTSWVPTGLVNLKNAINGGCGFVDFSGHGNAETWATHPHLDFGTWVPTPHSGFYNTDVVTLTNGNKLPIVTVEACHTSEFNANQNCFNWAFMYIQNGGAIGTFGATGFGWGYTGNYVDNGLIGKIGLDTFRAYVYDDSATLGEMWAKALTRSIKTNGDGGEYKTVEEWQIFGDPTLQLAPESGAPLKPAIPSGPTSGVPGTEYSFTTSTTDPEGDKISYLFDWGDDTTSGWIGPYNSGTTVSAKKTWSSKGTYQIKVVAKDTHGKLSSWSDPLTMSITKNKNRAIDTPFLQFLQNFLQDHPNLFQILQQVNQRLGL